MYLQKDSLVLYIRRGDEYYGDEYYAVRWGGCLRVGDVILATTNVEWTYSSATKDGKPVFHEQYIWRNYPSLEYLHVPELRGQRGEFSNTMKKVVVPRYIPDEEHEEGFDRVMRRLMLAPNLVTGSEPSLRLSSFEIRDRVKGEKLCWVFRRHWTAADTLERDWYEVFHYLRDDRGEPIDDRDPDDGEPFEMDLT